MFFCRKKCLFGKNAFMEKTFFLKKNFFWKKTCFCEKKIFLKKFFLKFFEKKIVYLWRLKVQAHKSPGA